MINQHQLKIAFAEGYHSGMIGEPFDNPFEDWDLRFQFNCGYRTATNRSESLYKNHNLEVLQNA